MMSEEYWEMQVGTAMEAVTAVQAPYLRGENIATTQELPSP